MQQPSISQVSLAIALYCSALKINSKYKHFTTKEWKKITETLKSNHLNPSDLLIKTKEELLHLGFTDAETEKLLGRAKSSVSLGMALSKLYSQGVNLITRADPEYPHHLKSKLGQMCPPLFYAVGTTSLLNADTKMVGVVGSRDVSEEDSRLTRQLVSRFVEHGYTIVSGGAKGIDSDAINQALNLGGSAIIFTSDPLLKQLRNTAYTHAMCQQRLVILSAQNPDLGFSVGYAMQRNRYIYTQAHATLVVKSSLNGGTWEGANDCLKHKYAPVLCIQSKHEGNQALISNGAIPVTEQWDGAIEGALEQFNIAKKQPQAQSYLLTDFIEAAPADLVMAAPASTITATMIAPSASTTVSSTPTKAST